MPRPERPLYHIKNRAKFDEASQEFQFSAERAIYNELHERAMRYEELREQLKLEVKRFDQLSRGAHSTPEKAALLKQAQEAIAYATTALQDMPRAVTILLLQNPIVYESIHRAGGIRGWTQLYCKDEERYRPLPALLGIVDRAVQSLRDPLITEK